MGQETCRYVTKNNNKQTKTEHKPTTTTTTTTTNNNNNKTEGCKINLHTSEFKSSVKVKVEVAVFGSPSLIVLMVSVDVKQH